MLFAALSIEFIGVFDMTTNAFSKPPKCFATLDDYNSWRNLIKDAGATPSGYCTDCTPAYKYRMQAQDRCQWPLTKFTHDQSGSMVGVRIFARARA